MDKIKGWIYGFDLEKVLIIVNKNHVTLCMVKLN
jgi:hypothetical protein